MHDDHGFVHRHLAKLRDHFEHHEDAGIQTTDGHRFAPASVRAVRATIDEVMEAEAEPSGAYYQSRSPIVSLVQSALHERMVQARALGEIEHDDERGTDAYTRSDIVHWVGNVALSLLSQALHPRHGFTTVPATTELADNARLVLFSDWGTGAKGACHVREAALPYINDTDRPVEVVHLGDTYYSGTPTEARHNVLRLWPVERGQSARVGSWALNGNHDMYSGGHGYFETILGEERFARQRAQGVPTSWFRMTSSRWNVLGLDTAWTNPLVEIVHGRFAFFGALGHLHEPQADLVADCAADPARRLLLLSHHQLFAAYDPDAHEDTPLSQQLARQRDGSLLDGSHIDAWFWGHEHDCLAYEPFRGVAAARSIGHGAIPEYVRTEPEAVPLHPGEEPPRLVKPVAAETTPPNHPLRALRWEYRDYRVGADNQRYAKHGFAVVDLDGEELQVTYVDDGGSVYNREVL